MPGVGGPGQRRHRQVDVLVGGDGAGHGDHRERLGHHLPAPDPGVLPDPELGRRVRRVVRHDAGVPPSGRRPSRGRRSPAAFSWDQLQLLGLGLHARSRRHLHGRRRLDRGRSRTPLGARSGSRRDRPRAALAFGTWSRLGSRPSGWPRCSSGRPASAWPPPVIRTPSGDVGARRESTSRPPRSTAEPRHDDHRRAGDHHVVRPTTTVRGATTTTPRATTTTRAPGATTTTTAAAGRDCTPAQIELTAVADRPTYAPSRARPRHRHPAEQVVGRLLAHRVHGRHRLQGRRGACSGARPPSSPTRSATCHWAPARPSRTAGRGTTPSTRPAPATGTVTWRLAGNTYTATATFQLT